VPLHRYTVGSMRISGVFFLCALCASAEVRTMTLRQALDLALKQSPDVMLARLDQQKAREQVIIAGDPFQPKVYVGTGLAYTSGPPVSIEGAAPSIFQAKTQMALFDRPQSLQKAVARENVRGSDSEIARQEDEVAYRVASLFLDAEQARQGLEAAQREAENLGRVRQLVAARVAEGQELPIKTREADVALLKSRQRVESLTLDAGDAEISLAVVLGLGADDRVRPSEEQRPPLAGADSEDQAIQSALESNPDLRRLQSNLQAKQLEIKGYRAARLPKINLVAQYELFTKYYINDYFTKFQRNGTQLGISIDVPLWVGSAPRAYISQAEADVAKIKTEVDRTRSRIAGDLRRAFQDVKRAETSREVARADLDLSREQLSIDLAQMDEGRLPMAAVEQARATEQEKWLVYYQSQHTVERARLNVLRLSGTLVASLK
jgi:outer membrane protein